MLRLSHDLSGSVILTVSSPDFGSSRGNCGAVTWRPYKGEKHIFRLLRCIHPYSNSLFEVYNKRNLVLLMIALQNRSCSPISPGKQCWHITLFQPLHANQGLVWSDWHIVLCPRGSTLCEVLQLWTWLSNGYHNRQVSPPVFFLFSGQGFIPRKHIIRLIFQVATLSWTWLKQCIKKELAQICSVL